MVKYIVSIAVLLCSIHTFGMESDASKEEVVSLKDIISFCERKGNPELVQAYKDQYERTKITDEYQKMLDHSILQSNRDHYIKYDMPVNIIKRSSSCPVCRNPFEHGKNEDTTTLLCCGRESHTFHIGCLVDWMVTGNKKTCPMCAAKIL